MTPPSGSPRLVVSRGAREFTSIRRSSERGADRELEVRSLLLPAGQGETVLVQDDLRVEVDPVDEPERRLEDGEEDPELEPRRLAHSENVHALSLDPGVARVEEDRDLERPREHVDVLEVEDEELVPPQKRPLL